MPRSRARRTAWHWSSNEPPVNRPPVLPQPNPISEISRPVFPTTRCFTAISRARGEVPKLTEVCIFAFHEAWRECTVRTVNARRLALQLCDTRKLGSNHQELGLASPDV